MKVFILIPTRDRKELLEKCLDSLGKQNYKDIEVVVIDDGSTDGTKQLLKKRKVTVIQGDGNLWWTESIRKGVEYALSNAKERDFILIQNDDTYMEPTYVSTLVKQSQENGRLVLGTPVVEYDTKYPVYNTHRVVKGLYRPLLVKESSDLIDTDTLSGRGTLIPIEVFDQVSNFSKFFPQYGADYDFFCKARRKGFDLKVSNKVVTYSTNSRPNLAKRIKNQERVTLGDFIKLYISRRSSNNLRSSVMITILYVPFLYKLLGLAMILLGMVKFFLVGFLYRNLRGIFEK